MNSNLYPKGPKNVPTDLTTPNSQYKRHILIASGALMLFMFLYFGLSSWLIYQSIKIFHDLFSGEKDGFDRILAATLMGFLGIFMFKALFFINKKDKSDAIEIKKEDEPDLFEFIHKIADEAKAPRPHKIYVSGEVNACVFYDVSIINLFFPTKKNLEIGLGLVNTLNLGEFKSIIAHEFGHFTQKSMLIGRWVYIAHKVAYQIVGKRDAFDKLLNGLSSTDFRIAWIGWILSILVWCIRAISETLFTLVVFTERALSREMEFHADLVAVSLTGSDAIVNSLYKLQSSDNAYEQALDFARLQLKKNRLLEDLFVIQENVIKKMAIVLDDPNYGSAPKESGANVIVFKETMAQPPKMWNTHPSNVDRERNAKATYISSEVDDRSTWLLFKSPEKLKYSVTQTIYKDLGKDVSHIPVSESLKLHDEEFNKSYLDPKYKGIYLNRPNFIAWSSINELYDMSFTDETLISHIQNLYPDTLKQQLQELKSVEEDIQMLEGLNNKVLDATQGRIYHRDRELRREELPEVILQVKKEAKDINNKIEEEFKICRNVHYAVAQKTGNHWAEYLASLSTLIHFCEHVQKNIETSSATFFEILQVVSSRKRLGSDDLDVLLAAANKLYDALGVVYYQSKKIDIGPRLKEKLGGRPFEALLEPFKLGMATKENINSWIGVVGGWLGLALDALSTVKGIALDELLYAEAYVREAFLNHQADGIDYAPAGAKIYANFKRFDAGEKKTERPKPGFFTRFYNAEGLGFTLLRIGIASSIIITAIYLTTEFSGSSVYVYNGLPIDVKVKIEDDEYDIRPNGHTQFEIDGNEGIVIKTTSLDGKLIESFTPELSKKTTTYVYNVAQAAILYQWTVHYGITQNTNDGFDKLLGTARWMQLKANYYFTEPPSRVSTKDGSATRRAVSVYNEHPYLQVGVLKDSMERANFISAHVRHERSNSLFINSWMSLGSTLSNFPEILNERLSRDPAEVISLRMLQEIKSGPEKEIVCASQNKMYQNHPDEPNLYYLKTRCMANGSEKDSMYLRGHLQWPNNPWLALATAQTYAESEQWNLAMGAFKTVYDHAVELQEVIVEDMARIYMFQNKHGEIENLDQALSPNLNFIKTVKMSDKSSEQNTRSRLYAYRLIEQGYIEEAVTYSETDSTINNHILLMAAVSTGANRSLIDKALEIPTEMSFTSNTFVPKLALAVRHHLPLQDFKAPLKNILREYGDSVLTFVDLVKANKVAEAEKLLSTFNIEMKGKTYLLGVLILGNNAPIKWKKMALGILFLTEKPYLELEF